MAHTKIRARGTSGDDFMHLKTSHIKSSNIMKLQSVHFETIHEKTVNIFLSKYLYLKIMWKFSPIFFRPLPIILATKTAFFLNAYSTLLTSPTLLKVASREKFLSKLQIRFNLLFDHSRLQSMVYANLFSI